MNSNNLVGKRFGRLVVLCDSGKRKSREIIWCCKCDCGNKLESRGPNLRLGNTKSCGCLNMERIYKHGDAINGPTRLYRSWIAMKQRCLNVNNIAYKYYGGRGIRVCDEWENDYLAFKEWASVNGYANNLTIDRINNDGNYKPSNCQWITQAKNNQKRWDEYQYTLRI